MPSILLVVFLLQLVIHLVNTVGVSTINNLVSSQGAGDIAQLTRISYGVSTTMSPPPNSPPSSEI